MCILTCKKPCISEAGLLLYVHYISKGQTADHCATSRMTQNTAKDNVLQRKSKQLHFVTFSNRKTWHLPETAHWRTNFELFWSYFVKNDFDLITHDIREIYIKEKCKRWIKGI